MKHVGSLVVVSLVVGALAPRAFADDPPAPAAAVGEGSVAQPAPPPLPPSPPTPSPPTIDQEKLKELEDRLSRVETKLKKTQDALDQATDDNADLADKVKALLPLSIKFGGYLDFGLFAVDGNGAGTMNDLGMTVFPGVNGRVPGSWVFWGDPLATAINSRGEPADTGESRAVTFDPIHAGAAPSFIVNAVNFTTFAGIGDNAQFNSSIDFVPRSRDVSDPAGIDMGDFIDVKLAYVEWRPQLDAFHLSLFAGKIDSVLGYEYRSMESPDRLSVTPSLICRYTCGRPLGVKARAKFLDDALIVNVAITNGSSFVEEFPFSDETDVNSMKTGSIRVSYQIAHKVELGVSGAFGAQDDQTSNSVYQWHSGADLHVDWHDFELTAEIVHGRADGATTPGSGLLCDIAPCIHYTGAYALLGYRATNTFIPYARVDYRNAVHENDPSFVYFSDLMRVTAGLRAEIGTRVIAKAEYTVIHELNAPQFPDNVFTSSLVVKY